MIASPAVSVNSRPIIDGRGGKIPLCQNEIRGFLERTRECGRAARKEVPLQSIEMPREFKSGIYVSRAWVSKGTCPHNGEKLLRLTAMAVAGVLLLPQWRLRNWTSLKRRFSWTAIMRPAPEWVN